MASDDRPDELRRLMDWQSEDLRRGRERFWHGLLTTAEAALLDHNGCDVCNRATSKAELCEMAHHLWRVMLTTQGIVYGDSDSDPAPDRSPLGSSPRGR